MTDERDNYSGPSWPYPTFLTLYTVLLSFFSDLGMRLGLTLYFALMAFCTWLAVSKKEFQGMKDTWPMLTRSQYVANMLFFPVIVPLIVIAIYLAV